MARVARRRAAGKPGSADASFRRQSQHDVPRDWVSRPVRRPRARRLQGGRVFFSLRAPARGHRRAAREKPSEPGIVQHHPGDWAGGERGLAAQPGREQEFRDGVDKAILYGKASKCPLLHTMAGRWPGGRERKQGERVYIENLRGPAARMPAGGLTAVMEPINTRDIPGYF